MLGNLPLPYSSKLDLYCGDKNGELWFKTLVHIDSDKDIITGMNPIIDDTQFYVNISNFKIPVSSKYSCKISLGTYTNNNLLLLNISKLYKLVNAVLHLCNNHLAGNNVDVTEFINSSVMHAVYTIFSGDSAINYHSDWNWSPSGSTRSTVFKKPTNTSENYKLSSLYPIMNIVISYILHLPKDFITHLIQLSFGKKTISDIVTPQESGMLDINNL